MNTHVNNFKTWNTRPLFVCGLAENPYLYNVTIKKKGIYLKHHSENTKIYF